MALSDSVTTALDECQHEARDGATVMLARYYAATIDAAPDAEVAAVLRDLGPKLLAALEALNMSPRARAAATKGATGGAAGAGGNPLDELREARKRRAAGQD